MQETVVVVTPEHGVQTITFEGHPAEAALLAGMISQRMGPAGARVFWREQLIAGASVRRWASFP